MLRKKYCRSAESFLRAEETPNRLNSSKNKHSAPSREKWFFNIPFGDKKSEYICLVKMKLVAINLVSWFAILTLYSGCKVQSPLPIKDKSILYLELTTYFLDTNGYKKIYDFTTIKELIDLLNEAQPHTPEGKEMTGYRINIQIRYIDGSTKCIMYEKSSKGNGIMYFYSNCFDGVFLGEYKNNNLISFFETLFDQSPDLPKLPK